MPSPFPGMDPYLEDHWGDIHAALVPYMREQLAPQLPDDLVARLQEYLAVEVDRERSAPGCYPDVRVTEQPGNGAQSTTASPSTVAVAEPVVVPLPAEPPTLRSIRIYDRGQRVVTAIELLSPANKIGADGRLSYRKKQRDLVDAGVSLVEIDLLRDGDYVLFPPEWCLPADCRGPYRLSVIRAGQPYQAEVFRLSLRKPLPAIRIPLRPTDADIVLDLQPLINRGYDFGGYRKIDYRLDPVPALRGDDAAWADALLREKGLR